MLFALIQNDFNLLKFDCLQIDILNTENLQNGVGKVGLKTWDLKDSPIIVQKKKKKKQDVWF